MEFDPIKPFMAFWENFAAREGLLMQKAYLQNLPLVVICCYRSYRLKL